MPTYTVRDPRSNKTVKLTGDSPPSEMELHQIFAELNQPASRAAASRDEVLPPAMRSTAPGGPAAPEQAMPIRRMATPNEIAEMEMGAQAGVLDFPKGAMQAAIGSVYKAGDLVRRGLGMERVVDQPDVQAAITPTTPMAKTGAFLEQGAEFAIPATKLAGVTKGAGLLTRAATQAAGAGAVGAVQSEGDVGETAIAAGLAGALPIAGAMARPVLGAARRAAAGAQEGGIGGAIAGAVRNAAPSEPKTLLVQGLKPRSSKINFGGALDRAIPELKAAERVIGKPIEGVDDLLKATKAAKAQIQQQLNVMRGPQRGMGARVDLSPVADAMTRSIPKKVALETPGAAQRLRAAANAYRRPFTLDDAENQRGTGRLL